MHHHITGLPVVDDEQRVVGVVSDYDLLSLDAVSGKMQVCPSRQTREGVFSNLVLGLLPGI